MMRLSCISTIVLAAVTLAACGSDGGVEPPGSPQNPVAGQLQEDATGARSNEAVAKAKTEESKPGYQALVEEQTAKPRKRFTPCNLVTQAQARAIVGEKVQPPLEATQGPTCIYETARGRFITVAIQAVDFRALKRQIGGDRAVSVSGTTAYCGKAGQPTLAMPLSGGRVLSVAAPCTIARQFALRAVQRLDA